MKLIWKAQTTPSWFYINCLCLLWLQNQSQKDDEDYHLWMIHSFNNWWASAKQKEHIKVSFFWGHSIQNWLIKFWQANVVSECSWGVNSRFFWVTRGSRGVDGGVNEHIAIVYLQQWKVLDNHIDAFFNPSPVWSCLILCKSLSLHLVSFSRRFISFPFKLLVDTLG